MQFRGKEDRLNPIAPDGVDDTTLGGYPAVHGRAPGFEGSDGRAYTVAVEAEAVEGAEGTFAAYLVFVRWAGSGNAIMGHLDSDDLAFGPSEAVARQSLEGLPLARVREILEETIRKYRAWNDSPDEGPAER